MRFSSLWRNSIRTLSNQAGWALLSLGTLIITALLFIASTLQSTTGGLVEGQETAMALTRAETQLLNYQRLSNIAVLVEDPALESTRDRTLRDIRGGLTAAIDDAAGTREADDLREATRSIERYIATRRTLEGLELPLTEIVATARPEFDAAYVQIRELRKAQHVRAENARAAAQQATTLAATTAIGLAVLIVVGLLVLVAGVRRHLLGPILRLRRTIERYDEGDPEVVADEGGPDEIAEIARAFNEMRHALEIRRKQQLAYVGGVAHDIRSPLSALGVGLELLARTPSDAGGETLTRLRRQLERLARMVGDLTDMTRVESGELELELEEFDLRQCLRDLIDLYRPISSKHVVDLCEPPEPVLVTADAGRVEQVVVNLLTNALKYSPEGGRITVGLTESEGRAEISVRDEGKGIAAAELAQIFEPFHRSPGSSKLGGPGAGLGLSIVRKIVRAHGGNIEVQSQPDAGSTFTAWIPRQAAHTKSERRASSGNRRPHAPSP